MDTFEVTFEFVPSRHAKPDGVRIDHSRLEWSQKQQLTGPGIAFFQLLLGALGIPALHVSEHSGVFEGRVSPAFTATLRGEHEACACLLSEALCFVFMQDSVLCTSSDSDALDCTARAVLSCGASAEDFIALDLGAHRGPGEVAVTITQDDPELVAQRLRDQAPFAEVWLSDPVGLYIASHNWSRDPDGDTARAREYPRLSELARAWRTFLARWSRAVPLDLHSLFDKGGAR